MKFGLLVLLLLFASCSQRSGRHKGRFIFLDVGAYDGISTKAFKTTGLYKKYPWEIWAIEPSEAAERIPKAPDVTVIKSAAWLFDGEIDVYLTTPEGVTSNSLYHVEPYNKTKTTWKCFNFSQWVKANFKKSDYVIFSLDVAGSEIPLLESMINDGTIDLIDRLYVEISYEMIAKSPEEHDQNVKKVYDIIKKVREKGILYDGDSVEDILRERYSWEDEL